MIAILNVNFKEGIILFESDISLLQNLFYVSSSF